MKSIWEKLNIVLIGMPGVGKSTLGVLAAKQLICPFIDTDLLIQSESGLRLQEIISMEGVEYFKRLEEQCICGLHVRGTIVATGGSVVYSSSAMKHLQRNGCIVWLSLSYENLVNRLGNLDVRGVVRTKGQSLLDLYEERGVLYSRYADITVSCDGLNHEAVVASMMKKLETIGSLEDLRQLRKDNIEV